MGYNLPVTTVKSMKLEGLRIYEAGDNVVAFKNKDFLSKDPERANSFALWPVPTGFTVGINANF